MGPPRRRGVAARGGRVAQAARTRASSAFSAGAGAGPGPQGNWRGGKSGRDRLATTDCCAETIIVNRISEHRFGVWFPLDEAAGPSALGDSRAGDVAAVRRGSPRDGGGA